MGFQKGNQFAKARGSKPAEPQTTPPESEWTLNGNPIPDHLKGLIPFRLTDQGTEQFNAGKEPARVQIVQDEFSKKLQQHEDTNPAVMPWQYTDPVEASKSRVPNVDGKRFGLLSSRVCEKDGLRGWQPERDKDGHEIKVGNMMLASMPEGMAAQRDRYYEGLSADAVTNAADDYSAKQEKMLRDTKGSDGLSPLSPGTSARRDARTRDVAEIGLQVAQGNSGDFINP